MPLASRNLDSCGQNLPFQVGDAGPELGSPAALEPPADRGHQSGGDREGQQPGASRRTRSRVKAGFRRSGNGLDEAGRR